MARFALVLEYEGTRYSGFQHQRDAPSVQEEIEQAIDRFSGAKVRVKAAGRTDAGVHARAQVVAFDLDRSWDAGTVKSAMNHHLPEDIAVKMAYQVNDHFDPRRDARSRRYKYSIGASSTRIPLVRRTVAWVRAPLSVQNMQLAAGEFIGVHDFKNFSGPLEKSGASTVREIYESTVCIEKDIIRIEVEGNAFLPHQVRRMTGSLVDVGKGRINFKDIRGMLNVNGMKGLVSALSMPARGLCLEDVKYDNFPPEAN